MFGFVSFLEGFIAVLVISPTAIPLQICQQMIPCGLELRAVESHANQPDPEGEQLVVADCFSHDGAALVDGLGGHGEAQVHIGFRPARMEGRIETSPFHCPTIEHGMEIECVISCPVIMLVAAVVAVIPNVLQLAEILGFLRGEPSGLFQHWLPHLLAPMLDTIFVDLQGFEQDVLLGVHNGHEVLEAVPVVVGGIHMDMEPAGIVGFPACVAQGADGTLKNFHVLVAKHRRHKLHLIAPVCGAEILAIHPILCTNAAVAHDFPLPPLGILHGPGVITGTYINGTGLDVVRQRFRRFPAGDAGEFDLYAELLVFDADHGASPDWPWGKGLKVGIKSFIISYSTKKHQPIGWCFGCNSV